MSVKELLAAATPLPWFAVPEGADVPGNFGIYTDESGGNRVGFRFEMDRCFDYYDAHLITHAVNHLPDYEAAVDVLRWIDEEYASTLNAECLWDDAYAKAREALARLRGTQ